MCEMEFYTQHPPHLCHKIAVEITAVGNCCPLGKINDTARMCNTLTCICLLSRCHGTCHTPFVRQKNFLNKHSGSDIEVFQTGNGTIGVVEEVGRHTEHMKVGIICILIEE